MELFLMFVDTWESRIVPLIGMCLKKRTTIDECTGNAAIEQNDGIMGYSHFIAGNVN